MHADTVSEVTVMFGFDLGMQLLKFALIVAS
jgi:hypothetical protein